MGAMIITRLILTNWRNFKSADIRLRDRVYVLGPNASGKSNLLDVFRFLRDIAKPDGGGLQKAVADRGGISKIRCLHARNKPTDVRIEIELSDHADAVEPRWRYILAFNSDGKVGQRPVVVTEQVYDGSRSLMTRPDDPDRGDRLRLTQTALESVQGNREFRAIADVLMSVQYLHLVPQLLKFDNQIGGRTLEDDPFGQGFLKRLARTPDKTRTARLNRIQQALQGAIPQFDEIRFTKDDETGQPHLEMRYAHHRPNAGWQREDQFSDGTLRLLALLWSLMDGSGPLLLEEPELSLNDAIVKQIPLLLKRARGSSKDGRQIIISTHSEAITSNPGIDGRSVIILEPQKEGTAVRAISDQEQERLEDGFTVAEVVLPKTRPAHVEQLVMPWR